MPIVFAKPILPATNLAASFNGSTSTLQRVNSGIVGAGEDAGSWSAWINLDASRSFGFLIGAGDSSNRSNVSSIGGTAFASANVFWSRYWQSGSTDKAFQMAYDSFDISTSETYLCHVVVNNPGNNVEGRVWFNGELVGWMKQITDVGSGNPTASTIQIGSSITLETTSAFSKGICKNVVFSSAYMTDSDAQALYALGPNGNPTPTLGGDITAWYPLNGDVNDASGNGYNLTNTDVTFVEAPAVAPVPGAIKFNDTFTDTNGTTLISHTPEVQNKNGNNWLEAEIFNVPIVTGSGTIQGNQAEFANDAQAVTTFIGRQNVKIEMDWSTGVASLNRSSIIFCYLNTDNFMYVNVREDNGDISLNQVVGGVLLGLQTTPFTWNEGQTYDIRMELDEDGVATGYIDNVLKVTGTVPRALRDRGSYGIARNTGSNQTNFDNFKITNL